ncbi:MAG: caspase family protein, partial [Planctomycetes bacterium]|nr:caspase family protein [Planctomycetota bacterium]
SMDGKDLTELANERLNGTYEYLPGQHVPVLFQRGELYRTELVLKEGADLVEPLLSLFFAGDDEWVIWTPQGYYDASPRGDRLIGWHVNRGPAKSAKHYSARQFRKHLYRPDIIDLILKTGDAAEAIRLANADRPHATATLDMRQSQVIRKLEPPRVRILEPAEGTRTRSPEITLRAEIRSQNELPVGEVVVLLNGRPLGEKQIVREKKGTGLGREISRKITLSPGENEISVLASNSASDSEPVSVRVAYEPVASTVTKPDLYLLAVGISDYAKKEMNLQFAHRDAEQFAAVWKGQKGRVYRNVQTRVLTNEEASVREILAGMDWLVKSATRRDVVVMFISAHGMRDERQNYYLASHEINPDNPRSTAVRFSEVKELLLDLPCKVILFVDTCHSGGITGSKSIGWDDPLRDLVAEQYGAVVFSSSSSREISLEDPAWNHGAFTKALLDTFGSAASDNNRDGYLSLTEVEGHVYSRVKELTRGRQHPVVERPPTIRNFNFFSVGS